MICESKTRKIKYFRGLNVRRYVHEGIAGLIQDWSRTLFSSLVFSQRSSQEGIVQLRPTRIFLTLGQGVISQGVETLIRALWFSCDAEQNWNQFAFPLSIRCQGKKNGTVQLEVGSDLFLYIFRSLQSIIRFDIWRISMRYTENIQVIFYSQSYKLRCFFAFYVYVVSKWPIEYYRLKVAFYLASQNQMIINGYKKICNVFILCFVHANFQSKLL